MKKTIKAIVPLIIVFFLFSACGKPPVNQSQSSEPAKDKEKVTSRIASKIIKVALNQTEDSNIVELLKEMNTELKEKTDGTLEMQLYPDSQLGNIIDITEAMTMGTIEATIAPAGALESFEPRFVIYAVSSIFNSVEETRKFLNDDLIQTINDEYRKKTGIVSLSMYDDGFRWIWTSKKPIRSLEDMRGLKIRTPPGVPLLSDIFKAMEADPVPLPWNDIYTAMQTSVVEGFDSPAEAVMGAKFTEVSKYAMTSTYLYSCSNFFITEKALNMMTPYEKEIFLNAEKTMAEKARALFDTTQNEYKKVLKSTGVVVTELSDAEKMRIKEAVKPIIVKYAKKYLTERELEKITSE